MNMHEWTILAEPEEMKYLDAQSLWGPGEGRPSLLGWIHIRTNPKEGGI